MGRKNRRTRGFVSEFFRMKMKNAENLKAGKNAMLTLLLTRQSPRHSAAPVRVRQRSQCHVQP